MKTISIHQICALGLAVLLTACGNSKKEGEGLLGEKKAQLSRLQSEAEKLKREMAELESEINKLDTASARKNEKGKLVSFTQLHPTTFSHFIEVQGEVDAENISYVSPRGSPGQVVEIFVRKGDVVRKGQKILKLDDRLNLQQQEQVKSQLSFARDILKRREDLWKQGIGSEVELLSARNNVEQLEKQLATIREQWATTNVVAEVNGMIDELSIRVGEIFQGGPQIRIVNTNALKVVTNVPEVYLSKVNRGSKMEVRVPDIGKQYSTSVQFISGAIDPSSRSFTAEGRLPADNALKPRQVAMVRILDYYAPAAIIVPVSTVQTDEKGKFVYVATQEGTQLVARKKPVATGQLQGDMVEIISGLTSGDKLITAGFQSLYNGQRISTEL